jgi:hypothetical protein
MLKSRENNSEEVTEENNAERTESPLSLSDSTTCCGLRARIKFAVAFGWYAFSSADGE